VLYVSEADAERTVAAAAQAGFTLLRAGSVEVGPKRVVLRSNGVTFEGASLQIR
jgi:hypothetical protein